MGFKDAPAKAQEIQMDAGKATTWPCVTTCVSTVMLSVLIAQALIDAFEEGKEFAMDTVADWYKPEHPGA